MPAPRAPYRLPVPEILHDFPVKAHRDAVFAAFTTPRGLDAWWTRRSVGTPEMGAEYELYFGPEYDWRGRVRRVVTNADFELEITRADPDWTSTRVSVQLSERDGGTWVRFAHLGWREESDHFRTSSYCWAMYLRILRRWVEKGEVVPYEKRLEA